jgi:RND family efflux transporter MFP subunit
MIMSVHESFALVRRRRAGSLSLLSVLLLLAACSDGPEALDEVQSASAATLISTATADRRTVERTERAVGRIETLSSPMVAAEVAGRVLEFRADVGDSVEEGDLLARIDPEPFELGLERARAHVSRLGARAAQLELELRRTERMVEREYASQAQFDIARAELDTAREELSAGRVAVRDAERRLRHTRIEAPVTGVVDARLVSEGGYVGVGDPAFRLTPTGRYRVRLPFPERVAERLAVGQRVRLWTVSEADANVLGELTRLRPEIDGAAQAIFALAEFDNPGGWRSGMTVHAAVILETRENAVTVPQLSVVDRPGRRVVYVIEDGVARERVVEIGVRTADWLEILSGLEGGETLAADGAHFLVDGARVRTHRGG